MIVGAGARLATRALILPGGFALDPGHLHEALTEHRTAATGRRVDAPTGLGADPLAVVGRRPGPGGGLHLR